MNRYTFTNFSNDPFSGRYAGQDYVFAPGETREFDPDKHYMLILLSKQLSTRELNKKLHAIGRDPKDMETWGKALDASGKVFRITTDGRKELMRQAIGDLVDTPIPTPDSQKEEAGATKEASADIQELKDQISTLTNAVTRLTTLQSDKDSTPVRGEPSVLRDDPIKAAPSGLEPEPSVVTRELLTTMAREKGIENVDSMTKEELIQAVGKQASI